MKIAGYSKISATASLISVNKNNKYYTHANKNMERNKTRHKNNNLEIKQGTKIIIYLIKLEYTI